MDTNDQDRVTAPLGELDTCRAHEGFWFECQYRHPSTALASPLDGLSPEAVAVFRWLRNHPAPDVFLTDDDAIASDVRRAHQLAETVLAVHHPDSGELAAPMPGSVNLPNADACRVERLTDRG